MSTMNISLPEELKNFVDGRIEAEGFGTSSEYIRELIRRDRDRAEFRDYLMDGVRAGNAGAMDKAYFSSLRGKVSSLRRKVTPASKNRA
ncbi:MAG: type II toxin-antitoxin system ParD family antitoxin [Burkholderiaceae bacterium]|nr:type II toxin-antitoxin system ParD family antitoxin [Burkholderiaceae bacterium]